MSETATKPQVKVSDVLELLNQGKDRKEIAEHYGIPVSVMARTVWQHPKLKNKKVPSCENQNQKSADFSELRRNPSIRFGACNALNSSCCCCC